MPTRTEKANPNEEFSWSLKALESARVNNKITLEQFAEVILPVLETIGFTKIAKIPDLRPNVLPELSRGILTKLHSIDPSTVENLVRFREQGTGVGR